MDSNSTLFKKCRQLKQKERKPASCPRCKQFLSGVGAVRLRSRPKLTKHMQKLLRKRKNNEKNLTARQRQLLQRAMQQCTTLVMKCSPCQWKTEIKLQSREALHQHKARRRLKAAQDSVGTEAEGGEGGGPGAERQALKKLRKKEKRKKAAEARAADRRHFQRLSTPVVDKVDERQDETPASSTAVSSTPVSSTLVTTPLSTTARSTMLLSSTLRSSIPGTPVSSTPVSSTPASSTPVSSTPVSSTPVSSMPLFSSPLPRKAASCVVLPSPFPPQRSSPPSESRVKTRSTPSVTPSPAGTRTVRKSDGQTNRQTPQSGRTTSGGQSGQHSKRQLRKVLGQKKKASLSASESLSQFLNSLK